MAQNADGDHRGTAGRQPHVAAPQVEDVDLEADSVPTKRYRPPYGPILVLLAVELCERLTYYTLAGSQKTYLNKQLGFAPSSAASINSVFSMLCYMWCLPGGLWADSIGRYKVIVAAGSLYAVGTILLAVGVHSSWQLPLKGVFMFAALVVLPIGTGGIKPNIANFGADQIGDATPEQKETQKKFFSFFYLSINVGVLIAFGYLINVTTMGASGLHIPVKEGYFAAYIVAASSMIVAISIFVLATRLFRLFPGGGIDGFCTMVRCVYHSMGRSNWRAFVAGLGWLLVPAFFVVTMAAALQGKPEASIPESISGNATHYFANSMEEACGLPHDMAAGAVPRRLHGGGAAGGQAGTMLTQLALGLGGAACTCLVVGHLHNGWIKAPSKDSAFTIQEVRASFATVPLIVVVNLSMNMAYNAMNNAFPSQACQMNSLLGGEQLNGAFFNLADALAIVILTPIFENCLYPAIERFRGTPVRIGQKLIVGLLFAGGANAVAAWMEVARRSSPLMCWKPESQCAPNGIHMRDMSAFWMFIPFAMIGAGEILVNPCLYYYVYTASPPKVRSLVQAFNLFCSGSLSNAFTAVATKATFPDDLDTGRLERYYFVNIACVVVGIGLYFWVTRCGEKTEAIEVNGIEEASTESDRDVGCGQVFDSGDESTEAGDE